MSTDIRALCAELLDWVERASDLHRYGTGDLMARARAALAEPVGEGPSDEQADAWACEMEFVRGHAEHPCGFWISDGDAGRLVRAALARWGRPPAPPATEPNGGWGAVAIAAQDMRSRGQAEQMAGEELLKLANSNRSQPARSAIPLPAPQAAEVQP